MARTTPGEVKAQLPASPPGDAGGASRQVFRDLERIILPGLSHWQHPELLRLLPRQRRRSRACWATTSAPGLGVLGLSWQSSPALTELEEVVTDWVRQMVGLSGAWSGVIQDTASTCTLVALLCARERATGLRPEPGRLAGGAAAPGGLRLRARPIAPSTRRRCWRDSGGTTSRSSPTTRRMPCALIRSPRPIERDIAAGKRPCAVVATTGTTTSTALDPVGAIAQIAREHGLWLHVDAAMAGSAMILPECRWMWEGVEEADSLVINAHKWLGAAFDCSLYYVRDPEHLDPGDVHRSELPEVLGGRAGQEPAGLGHPAGPAVPSPEAVVPAPRRGGQRLAGPAPPGLDNARWLAERVRSAPGWRVLAPVPLQTVCVPSRAARAWTGEALDRAHAGLGRAGQPLGRRPT